MAGKFLYSSALVIAAALAGSAFSQTEDRTLPAKGAGLSAANITTPKQALNKASLAKRTSSLLSGCGPQCTFCWLGGPFENDCLAEWEGDGDCDCGCQFSDASDCGGGGGGGCGPECDFCWVGTANENDCPVFFRGDFDCDCGCQFPDTLDCTGCTDDCGDGVCVAGPPCFEDVQSCAWDCAASCSCASSCDFCWCGTINQNNCLPEWNGTGDGCDCACQFEDPDCDTCVCGDDVCDPKCGETSDTCRTDCPCHILSSDPPSCTIDARQPSDLDGSSPCGFDSIDITFDCNTTLLTAGDFDVLAVPPGLSPGIANLVPNGNTLTIELTAHIPTGQWTAVRTLGSAESVYIGRLPADANNDGTSGTLDILGLIDCLNGVAACLPWQCDLNCSGACNASDILRIIDLLNGAQQYDAWLGATLQACPG